MRSMILLAALIVLAPCGAQAADITVYSPGIVNGPLKQLAASWTAETGNKVNFAGNNVGRIRTAVTTDAPGWYHPGRSGVLVQTRHPAEQKQRSSGQPGAVAWRAWS